MAAFAAAAAADPALARAVAELAEPGRRSWTGCRPPRRCRLVAPPRLRAPPAPGEARHGCAAQVAAAADLARRGLRGPVRRPGRPARIDRRGPARPGRSCWRDRRWLTERQGCSGRGHGERRAGRGPGRRARRRLGLRRRRRRPGGRRPPARPAPPRPPTATSATRSPRCSPRGGARRRREGRLRAALPGAVRRRRGRARSRPGGRRRPRPGCGCSTRRRSARPGSWPSA